MTVSLLVNSKGNQVILLLFQVVWKDPRLTYLNLNPRMNKLDPETKAKLWTPPLVFSNTDNNDRIVNNDDINLYVYNPDSTKFRVNTITEAHEKLIFEGVDNDLVLVKDIELNLRCPFDLSHFPFDRQVCPIDVSFPEVLGKFIELVPVLAINSGPQELAQFIVEDIQMTTADGTSQGGQIGGTDPWGKSGQKIGTNGTQIVVRVTLKRRPFYHLATTFLPTLCIAIMSLVTLFIDESHFEATIMVALTDMLVMYTLYQSINTELPNTAYLKLIDFWLLFCLLLPFIIFVVEVSWELMGYEVEKNNSSSVKPFEQFKEIKRTSIFEEYEKREEKRTFKRRAKLCMQIFLPLTSILFVISYTIAAYTVYNSDPN